ncbi:MAG: S41 family peptidase [Treponema sp.]|jgi:carboxyl-terminal processing protease|nr:S41 family peptidase [Treponema sp.]
MEEQNTSLIPAKRGKLPKELPQSLIWVVSTVVFCVIFAITLAPRAKAQIRGGWGASSQYIAIIRNVFDFIQRNYVEEIDPNVLFEGAMTGMLNSLDDPYSAFLPEAEMKDLNDTTQGSFGGVGLYVSKPITPRPDGNYLEVASPIEDTPGWRAGINPGDIILQIEGESTDKLSSDEAVARLRGQPGTEVKLLIRRGENIEFPVTIVRAIIEVPTVKHDMIGDIGFLKLLTFTPRTLERSREAISDFQTKSYKGIILDLRNNYGGLLHSAVGISNLFIEGGIIVSIKSRIESENQTFYARGTAMVPPDIPMIVLINRASASASEIVAGALKDRGRAYLVGEKSYGKGSVQQVFPLNNVGFKITTARYYTPSDVNIDKIGIPPDREILFPEFSRADSEKLNSLINSNRVSDFVKLNPNAGVAEIDAFTLVLNRDFNLEIPLLKRLVRNELNRRTIAPVYDLEIDVQLQEAVKILREENYRTLMQTSKTLKALQEEAEQDELLLAS